MPRKVNVIGVGMVPFQKPGKSEEYYVMATKAGTAALTDAKVPYNEVQQAYAGYVYGDSTCGQRAIYQLGLTGIPVFNVNNNCSTGSSALMLGAQAIAGGIAECVIVVGFEQMEAGALQAKWTDRANPLGLQAPFAGAFANDFQRAAAILGGDIARMQHGRVAPHQVAHLPRRLGRRRSGARREDPAPDRGAPRRGAIE